MNKLSIILLLSIFCTAIQAQSLRAAPHLASQVPRFPGGGEMLAAFFQENLRYPDLAHENGIEGEVGLRLALSEKGEIENVKIAKPLGLGCDEEAVRLVLALPSWHPATLDGKPIASETYLRIRFRLQ